MYQLRSFRRRGKYWPDSWFLRLERVLVESGADAASIHITSLWKIRSIDLTLIRQAALGIPLRLLPGQLRSKREPKRVGLGAGASPAFPIDPDATLVARQQPPVSPGPSSPRGCKIGQ